MSCLAVIPARWGSSRLPGKPLALIGGVPMVELVRRRVAATPGVDRVVVATDDQRIVEALAPHAILTVPADSGTDRVAAVARSAPEDLILNVQGDMPFVEPAHVRAVVEILRDGARCATLAAPYAGDPADPHLVKVVLDPGGRALYFSRLPVPRGGPWHLHVGIYGFVSTTLARLASLPKSALERAEDLEQLRWLEAGQEVRVARVSAPVSAVDTREQLESLRARLARGELTLPQDPQTQE